MKKLIDHDLIDLTMIPPPMTPDEVMILQQHLCSIKDRQFLILKLYYEINIESINKI